MVCASAIQSEWIITYLLKDSKDRKFFRLSFQRFRTVLQVSKPGVSPSAFNWY